MELKVQVDREVIKCLICFNKNLNTLEVAMGSNEMEVREIILKINNFRIIE